MKSMDEKRRQFIVGMTTIFGAAALDGFGLLKASSFQNETKPEKEVFSKALKDYPHIKDIFPSKDLESFFPIIADSCLEPKMDYLAKIPFLIELEVSKIWKESSFKSYSLSNSAAGGLQQFMALTARDVGLKVADSPEIQNLNSIISSYRDIQRNIGIKKQELHNLVGSSNNGLTQNEINDINRLRAEIGELNKKLPEAYITLRNAKTEYVNKVTNMTREQLMEFDARFVPELAIPAGVKYMVKGIIECQKSFGGSIEMNVWRGVAAYNSGIEQTKRSDGLPYIQETVNYTRKVISDLTKALELKSAYSTGDMAIIIQTKKRLGVSI
jgi:hypothetical protein